jgi:hypothetical protein
MRQKGAGVPGLPQLGAERDEAGDTPLGAMLVEGDDLVNRGVVTGQFRRGRGGEQIHRAELPGEALDQRKGEDDVAEVRGLDDQRPVGGH